jgi:hypothetical protein
LTWAKHLRCRVFARQPFGFSAHLNARLSF